MGLIITGQENTGGNSNGTLKPALRAYLFLVFHLIGLAYDIYHKILFLTNLYTKLSIIQSRNPFSFDFRFLGMIKLEGEEGEGDEGPSYKV
jgi:hypothetical protein